MKETVKVLAEQSAMPSMDFATANMCSFEEMAPVDESVNDALKYTAQKVIVTKSKNNGYIVEFANNLERFMIDHEMGINEAMNIISNINDIPVEECTVVFDESCVNKIDFKKLGQLDKEYSVARV